MVKSISFFFFIQSVFSEWVNNGSCTTTCGRGKQLQTRLCLKGGCNQTELIQFVPCFNEKCVGKIHNNFYIKLLFIFNSRWRHTAYLL